MQWEKLLSTARLGGAIEIPYNQENFPTSEFEKDYWRILNCPSFRRLQDKTQVFPLDKSDFVRTRLTHSLEVSALAKQLVMMAYRRINRENPSPNEAETRERYPFTLEDAQQAADVAACAGLLHDIGNPPFGHFGETIMCSWFTNNRRKLFYYDTVEEKRVSLTQERLLSDLKHFEGNAQALRLLTKLHYTDSDFGLNLTSAVLNTIVKYPTDSLHIDAKAENIYIHKLGYYQADEGFFHQTAEDTGTYFDGEYHRHPLTFILEAADDIAYATADLEDSYKKGLFTLEEFSGFFRQQIEECCIDENQTHFSNVLIDQLDAYKNDGAPDSRAFHQWINYTRHWLVFCAAYGFSKNYRKIMEGTYRSEIIQGTNHQGTMEILKNAMKKFTYNSPEILKLELAAEKIIGGLMGRFIPAAIDWDVPSGSRMANRNAEKKLISLVSENHKAAYLRYKTEDKEYNLYLRLLLIADFVSGMSDTYAKTTYQELNGIQPLCP